MRLITWNCNRAFHRKHQFIAPLRPDILIVQECERIVSLPELPNSRVPKSLQWFGANPKKGLVVISHGEYTLQVDPSYEPDIRWIVPLRISGPLTFVLFAVWTLPRGSSAGLWVRPLADAFDYYKSKIDISESIWVGDFNSNIIWDKPSRRYKFRDFVSQLGQHGLSSLYHHRRQCEHGKETDYTLYHLYKQDKGYHIDYVFAPEKFHPGGVDVFIGPYADWSKRSDHLPLVCDLIL